jgi:hypothetical protein
MMLNPLLPKNAIFSQEKPKLLPALSFPKFGISFSWSSLIFLEVCWNFLFNTDCIDQFLAARQKISKST